MSTTTTTYRQPVMPTLGSFVYCADSPDELYFMDDPPNAVPTMDLGPPARAAAAVETPPRQSYTRSGTSYRRAVAASVQRHLLTSD